MSNQSKIVRTESDRKCYNPEPNAKHTTDEWWTEQDVDGCWHIGVGNRGFAELDEETAKAIANAHNAALAAEDDELRKQIADLFNDNERLRDQLAAEREQGVKVLAQRSFELHECQKKLNDTLRREFHVAQRFTELQKQLADEQEKVQNMHNLLGALSIQEKLLANELSPPEYAKRIMGTYEQPNPTSE